MRRRIALFLTALLAGATLAVAGSSAPAGATAVCAGTGTATVAPALWGPITINAAAGTPPATVDILIGLNTLHTWGFSQDLGACLPGGPLVNANGTLRGFCGFATGVGTTTDGYLLTFVGIGALLVITGHLTGVVAVIPDPTTPTPTCIHGGDLALAGTSRFIIAGAAAKLHCSTLADTLQPLPGALTTVTQQVGGTTVNVRVHTANHLWANPCVPRAL